MYDEEIPNVEEMDQADCMISMLSKNAFAKQKESKMPQLQVVSHRIVHQVEVLKSLHPPFGTIHFSVNG